MSAPPPKKGLVGEFVGLKKLWPYLRSQKRAIVVAALLIPVISALQVSFPLVLRYTIDHGIMEGEVRALVIGAAIYLAIVLVEYGVRALQSITSARAVFRMIRDLRMKLVSHVLGLKCSYHDRSLSGALVTRATGDFDNLSESLNMGVLTSVVDVAVLVGCVVGMFLLDWRLALLAVVVVPIVWGIVQWFSKALKASMLRARIKIAALNGYTQECLYGNATIKLLTAEDAAAKTFDGLNEEYRKAQMGAVVLDAMMFSVLDGIASVTVGLALWLAVDRVAGGSAAAAGLTAGVLVAFVAYVQQLFEPLKQLGNKIAMLQGAFTAIDRIFGLLDERHPIGGDLPTASLRGDVRFERVTYRYDRGDGTAPAALTDVSFELAGGQSLALVGPTGSGKSTVIKLLTKLYDGYEGRILVDGKDLATLEPVGFRRYVAVVPQDVVLFDGDLFFNIALGDPDVTEDAVRGALSELGAEDLLRSLPKGLRSEIKEQGRNLSHGQRQLIAFARALVKRPGLVVLDEATSSVDPESEAQIQRATQKLLRSRSVIVVAHRLSTIRQCDRIVVLERGRVVEQGRHEELLGRRGAYYGLHEAFA